LPHVRILEPLSIPKPFSWATRHEEAQTKGQEKTHEQRQTKRRNHGRKMAQQTREALPKKTNHATIQFFENQHQISGFLNTLGHKRSELKRSKYEEHSVRSNQRSILIGGGL
jgi:hypothetical protein